MNGRKIIARSFGFFVLFWLSKEKKRKTVIANKIKRRKYLFTEQINIDFVVHFVFKRAL